MQRAVYRVLGSLVAECELLQYLAKMLNGSRTGKASQ